MADFFSTRIKARFLSVENSFVVGRNNLNNSVNHTLFDSPEHSPEEFEELNKIGNGVFYFSVVLIALMGLFCTLGNGLVLYISNKNQDFGGFREINSVVKQLAMSDFLFGVLGCPLTIVWWYWGKKYCISLCIFSFQLFF